MSRAPRVDVGNVIYHIINRANGRHTLFHKPEDYKHLEELLQLAKERTDVAVLGYIVMPNHWHLVVRPKENGDLSTFMQWLTLTHTQQYHARKRTIGHGHLYQGRYKSFIIEDDKYLLTVIKYIERNPVRARLCKKVEEWQWGSGYRRLEGIAKEKALLTELPTDVPRNYREWVNTPDKENDLKELRISVNKGKPFGTMNWAEHMIKRFGLELTTRGRGRPKKI
jgi:putative transposase